MKIDSIAINLFNVHTDLEKDFAGTMARLAEMGYPAVQLSGFRLRDHDPVRLKELLDGLGLKTAGCHASVYDLDVDTTYFVDYMKVMQSSYIISPMVPEEFSRDAEGYRRLAETFNKIGGEIKAQGMTFGYHNHAFEFQRFGDCTGLDIIMDNTEPELVTFEPDVYWIQKGGGNIRAILEKYDRKCPLVHIKDMEDGPEGFFCEIGEGVIDFQEVFALGDSMGAVWFIVEQDAGRRPPLESARISLKNIRNMARTE